MKINKNTTKITPDLLRLIDSEQITLLNGKQVGNDYEYDVHFNYGRIEIESVIMDVTKEKQLENIIKILNNEI